MVRLNIVVRACRNSGRPAASAPLAVGRRVLLIEDNTDTIEMLCVLPRLVGHLASWAFDGIARLDMALGRSDDAIVGDIGLPGMNLARRLHRQMQCEYR